MNIMHIYHKGFHHAREHDCQVLYFIGSLENGFKFEHLVSDHHYDHGSEHRSGQIPQLH